MSLLVLVHVFRLKSGTYAARSREFHDCLGEDVNAESALARLEAAIAGKIPKILDQGDVPPFLTYEEVETEMPKRCKEDIFDPARLPGSRDVVLIRRLKLPFDLTEQIKELRKKRDGDRSAVAATAEKLTRMKELMPTSTFRTQVDGQIQILPDRSRPN
jgi:hypothetical protein